jgi:ketosteroid isomerase-like protein
MTKTMNLTRFVIAVSIAIVFVFLAATAYSQQDDSKADKAALDNITKITIKAFNQGNIENYIALIADDAVYMPPGVGAILGKDAIRDWYKGVISNNQFDIDIINESTELHGEFAFERVVWKGTSTSKKGGEPFHHNSMCLNVLRKQADGTWKIWKSIWNRNREEKDTEN